MTAAALPHAQGQTFSEWNAADGLWTVPENWEPTGVPTSEGIAIIDNDGTARIAIGETVEAAAVAVGFTDTGGASRLVIEGQFHTTTTGLVGHDGGNGLVTITGTGAVWNHSTSVPGGGFSIGNEGRGMVEILDGGSLNVTGGSVLYIGTRPLARWSSPAPAADCM